ncbi:hypothetical protein IGJ55_002715 [Enterococcus sp. AZ170]
MIIPFIPFLVFVEIGIIHILIYYLTNRVWKNLKFGPNLYITGLLSGVISYVVDWYGIYPFLFARITEGFMLGIGLFLYMSWVIVPACYLIMLSIFYLIKKRRKNC